MRAPTLSTLLLSFPVLGCSFDFDDSSEVTDRRILALQTDPPEIAGGMEPPPRAIAIRALVVDPRAPDASADYEWRACLIERVASKKGGGNSGGGMPRGGGAEGGSLTLCEESDPSTLIERGNRTLSELAVDVPLALDPSNNGEPPQIQVQLKVASTAGDLYAIKKVTVTPRLPEGQVPNANPRLTGLSFDGEEWAATTARIVKYGVCPAEQKKKVEDSSNPTPVTVCGHKIAPLFDEAEAQYYQGVLGDGTVETEREQLRFDWFADQGSLTSAHTSQPDPGESAAADGLATTWLEPAAKVERATLWVVVRDGRGGLSWQERQIVFQ